MTRREGHYARVMGTPLLTVAELRAIEESAQQQLAAGELMLRAGRAAARAIDAWAAERRLSACIVAGPGNNGGDGFVVGLELMNRGHRVACVLLAERPTTADANAAFERYRAAGGAVVHTLPDQRFDVAVDAMFGIGLTRPLQGRFLEAVRWIAHTGHVVALDVPSGLDADRGGWIGGIEGVRADTTITFIGDKPGLHTGAGCDAAGQVLVESIGVDAAPSGVSLTDPNDFDSITRRRRRDTHKGTFGSALIVGDGAGMVGAPLLAARAALRLGAGRVYIDCIGAPDVRLDPLQPELMFRAHAALAELDCIIVGCGLGTDAAARAALAWAVAQPTAIVVDADALNLMAGDATLCAALSARSAPTVLTPHPLEAARLLKSSVQQVQRDRLAAARALTREFQAIVLLKGAGTVIAEPKPNGRVVINPTGSPALATAGSGDVLAGMVGAVLAQKFDAWQATLAACWLHGEAVHGLGDVGTVASDIAPRAASVLATLRERG